MSLVAGESMQAVAGTPGSGESAEFERVPEDVRRDEFYADEPAVSETALRFLKEGLVSGRGTVAIVTAARRRDLEGQLVGLGIDVAALLEKQRLVFADAPSVLAQVSIDSMPNSDRFMSEMNGLLSSTNCDGLSVYAEMFEVPWSSSHDVTTKLEQMWCRLQAARRLSLLCVYPLEGSSGRPESLRRVCALYEHIHAEGAGSASRTLGTAVSALSNTSYEQLRALLSDIKTRRDAESALQASLHALKLTEASLRDRETLLGTITDALPALVSYVGTDGRYQFVNATYERWFSQPRSNFIGRRLEDVLGNAAYAKIRNHVTAALRGEGRRFIDHLHYLRAGERRIDASYVPHFAADGQVLGFVALVSDVSERARLQRARDAAAERTERLMKITGALAEAVEAEQVFCAMVDQSAATLGASSAAIFRVRRDADVVDLVHDVGYPAAGRAALHGLHLHSPQRIPVLDAIARSEPVWLRSQTDLLSRYPNLASIATPGRDYQTACLPILVEGRCHGALAFTFDNSPPIEREQQDFLLLVARYGAQAMERLRLLEAERSLRANAELAAARADLLSRASRAFAEAGTDLHHVLDTIMQQLVSQYAEAAVITLVEDDDLRLGAFQHRDPEARRLLRELVETTPPKLRDSLTARVIASGEPLLIPVVDASELLARTNPEHRGWAEQYMPASIIFAPLRTRARIIGTIGASRGRDQAPFGQEDVRFMQELGERAAMAIEASRLYQDNLHARHRTELLYGLARVVIAAETIDGVFDAALDTLERAVGATRAAILTYDASEVMRFRAWRGLSPEYRRAVEGHSPWSSGARNPQPMFVADVRRASNLARFLDLFEKERIGALGFIPLLAGSKLVGKFMLYYETPRQIAEHELELAVAIANHVAAAASRFAAVDELQNTVHFNEMFTGMLGHDLRNPLGAIMTAAHVASRRSSDERTSKPLARILSSGERMARMIDQLLDFTRVRVGQGIPVYAQPVDLVPLLLQVVEELEGALPVRRVEVASTGNTDGQWDPDLLAQVFSNLVANALHHGDPSHGVSVRVDGSHETRVGVEVHNHGAIDRAVLPRLFEPMTGGDRRGQNSRGLGLGLYISKQIIVSHGGSIDVTSDADEGTTFVVTLPRSSALDVTMNGEIAK